MNTHSKRGPFLKVFLIPFLVIGMVGGLAKAQQKPSKAPSAGTDKDKKADDKDKDKDGDKDKDKVEVRNNAASLLADLLGQEKDLDKILIIKHPTQGTKNVVKAISKTASDGGDRLEALAKSDPSLNLHALQLPPGEVATREAISKTKEKELLLTFGTKAELNLLLSQTDALDYASHLAKIAADNANSPEEQKEFHLLDTQLSHLFDQVVARIRAMPRQ